MERTPVDQAHVASLCTALLVALGEDPAREGLQDTPRRWAKMWAEFVDYAPGTLDTTFETTSADQMVLVSGMRVWSLCEHHLLPFWCDVAVAYIAHERLIGLSKIGRIAHKFAHKLQVQEQLGRDIADAVQDACDTVNVGVLLRGEHLCMSMRGIRTPALMTSSVVRGVFASQPTTRAEFMSLATTALR